MPEQLTGHLPEAVLGGRGLAGQRRGPSVRVHVLQRQVPEDVAQVIAQSLTELGDRPVALPQNGHSKSPYSTSVSGASTRPRRWSRSGSTGRSSCTGGPLRAASARPRQKISRAEAGGDQRGREHPDPCLVLQRRVVEGQVDDEQRDRETDAGESRTTAQLLVGRGPVAARPTASRPHRAAPEQDADELAEHQPGDHAPGEPGGRRRRERSADRDTPALASAKSGQHDQRDHGAHSSCSRSFDRHRARMLTPGRPLPTPGRATAGTPGVTPRRRSTSSRCGG